MLKARRGSKWDQALNLVSIAWKCDPQNGRMPWMDSAWNAVGYFEGAAYVKSRAEKQRLLRLGDKALEEANKAFSAFVASGY